MKGIVAILLISLIACKGKSAPKNSSNKYTPIVQAADSIGISFKFEDSAAGVYRISTLYEKDRSIINAIGNIFSNKEEACSCKAIGYLEVYAKDTITLNIPVVISSLGSGKDCTFLIIKEGDKEICYRLSYSVGRYLEELRNDMK
jgi:hypothetical protein